MKDPNFFKQDDSDPATLALRDLGAKFYKQSFYVAPLDVAACGASEDQFKGALVFPLHSRAMVP